MNEQALEQTVIRLAEPAVHALGLIIWGVEIAQAGRTVLRLFVDVPSADKQPEEGAEASESTDAVFGGPHSASIDQCEEISRHLGLVLEVEDVMPAAYVLEVSTPGLSRRFFDVGQMRPYLGDMVEARLHMAHEGRRIWRGRLVAVEDTVFTLAPASLTPEGEVLPEEVAPVQLPWDAVRRASRIHVFRQPSKPGKRPGKKGGKQFGKKADVGADKPDEALLTEISET